MPDRPDYRELREALADVARAADDCDPESGECDGRCARSLKFLAKLAQAHTPALLADLDATRAREDALIAEVAQLRAALTDDNVAAATQQARVWLMGTGAMTLAQVDESAPACARDILRAARKAYDKEAPDDRK